MFPGFSFSFRRLARRFRLEHHVLEPLPATVPTPERISA
jgi:hypothetical protein